MSQQADAFALSKALFESGYASTSTIESVVRATATVEYVQEDAVARVLTMMVRTHLSLPGANEGHTWEIGNFVEAMKQINPSLSWATVMLKLDQAEMVLYEQGGLKILVDVWNYSQQGKSSKEPFPVHAFFRPWQNARGQLSILYHMLCAPHEVLDLASNPTITNVIRPVHIMGLHATVRPIAMRLAASQLNCVEIISVILDLAESSTSDDVRVLLDRLTLQTPELLLLGLAQIQPIRSGLHRDLLIKLLSIFLIGHANTSLVMSILWRVQPALLLEGLLDMYKKEPASVPRILDIAQEAKILVHILHADVPFFTLDLAALAARRQNLNLEKWLPERLNEDGIPFAVACIDFLEKKCTDEVGRHSQGNSSAMSVHLSKDVFRIFFRILSERPLPQRDSERLLNIMQFYSQLLAQLKSRSPPESRSAPPGYGPEANGDSSAEVEEMVRLYFERLYTNELSAEQFIAVLNACNESKDQKQADFFSCTVHTLLDEARFFNQYPDHELAVTGKLFGLLIDKHLISSSLLRLALKHVLDALNHPLGTKIFNFGVLALAQFRSRLSEWPQYTMILSKIAGLKEYPPIVDSIAKALQQLASTIDTERPQNSPSVSEKTNKSAKMSDEIINPKQSGLLEKSANAIMYTPPPSDVQEKIAFTINNLSLSNMDEKVSQIEPLIDEPTFGWFSHYLVVRRVTRERNNHELYAKLLIALDKPSLCDAVVEETYKNIQILLQAPGTPDSQMDRNALKSLGSWLGRITLAKNKPIRHKDLSFKDLLLDSYDHNLLIVAIPLTCKVLQEAKDSKIFKPPNPWLMKILKLLAELYWHEDLRLNLKFEIELLYKTLSLDLNEVEPTSLLEERKHLAAHPNGAEEQFDQQQQQFDNQQQQFDNQQQQFDNQQPQFGQQQMFDQHQQFEHQQKALQQQMTPPATQAFQPKLEDAHNDEQRTWSSDEKTFNIDVSSLLARLQFSTAVLHVFEQQPLTKRVVLNAISESYKKVVSPAIATAANIACISTRHLVIKDLATDPDEMKLKRAAQRMVGTLAGSLSVATCKEPLCNNIINMIRTQFGQMHIPETAADEIGGSVILDNMELMEAFIEQLGQMRAIGEIDRAIAASYNSRRVHKEQHIRSPYFDVLSFQGSPHNVNLPDALRPNGSIDIEQMQVYDMYDHLPSHSAESRVPNIQENAPANNFATKAPGEPLPPPHDAAGSNMTDSKLEGLLAEMDQYVRQAATNNFKNFKELPPDHEVCQFLRQFFMFIRNSNLPVQHMQTFTEKVVLVLYESNNLLTLETYTVFLQIILELYPTLAREVISWLVYADDERKYNAQVTAMCMSYDLVPMEEYDTQLSRLVRAKADGIMDYAAALIRLCLLSNNPDSILEDHVLTVAALNQLVHDGEAPPSVQAVISDLQSHYEKPYTRVKSTGLDYLELQLLLAEWTRFCLHPLSSDSMLDTFASQILQKITVSEEKQTAFLRLCIQTSVQQYMTFCNLSLPQQARMKESTDSVARLIACMVAVRADKRDQPEAATKLLSNALSICVLLLAHCHEVQGSSFDQRPFLRFFISSYIEVSKKVPNLSPITTFSEILYSIRPTILPGFAFSWLQLISHRVILSDLLAGNDPDQWRLCCKLIVVLLDFLGMIVDEGGLAMQSAQLFYRSTLRALVVLLHDFPEFLSHYYMSFVMVVPHSCVQIRNLILSAFPKTMRLPDPSAPDMQLDGLPEYNESPTMATEYIHLLDDGQTDSLKIQAIRYLESSNTKGEPTFFSAALEFLKKSDSDDSPFVSCHADRMEALVLFLGVQSITGDGVSYENIGANPAVRVYVYLLRQMSPQGRYLLLNAIVDQLRYPNSHTYFFRTVVLHLFASQAEDIKENITRVLLERLIVNRPHPWGLLATFIELLSAPDFWQHKFIHAAPDFERLFDNVSRYVKHRA